MEIRNRFKNFGGNYIPDIIEYLREYINQYPDVTISVGCDSIQRRRKTIYAITIMLYRNSIKSGAHVVFFRESVTKVKDNEDRLDKEALYCYEVGQYLHDNLKEFYERKDLTDFERRRYKYHLLKCMGEYSHVSPLNEHGVIKNLSLTDEDTAISTMLVDLHLDYNPQEGIIDEKKKTYKNKSYASYKEHAGWIRSAGYRVWVKPLGYASTSAADLLLES